MPVRAVQTHTQTHRHQQWVLEPHPTWVSLMALLIGHLSLLHSVPVSSLLASFPDHWRDRHFGNQIRGGLQRTRWVWEGLCFQKHFKCMLQGICAILRLHCSFSEFVTGQT